MTDIRSYKSSNTSSPDVYVDQIRKQIGEDFTDKKVSGRKSKNELGKDDFIKLMSAQLKHQDPTSPMKNEEMAAQLAQFSSLEQMVNVNTNLEKMSAAQKPQENVMAASLIGKKVVTDSSRLSLKAGDEPTIKFNLPGDASKTSVNIMNNKGEVVREYKMTGTKTGIQAVKWDGKNEKGQALPLGDYTFSVIAQDAQDKPMRISLSTSGTVSGVVFEGGKPQLIVDGKKVGLDVIGQIGEVGDERAAGSVVATPAKSINEAAQAAIASFKNQMPGNGAAKMAPTGKNNNSLSPPSASENKSNAPSEKDYANEAKSGKIDKVVSSNEALSLEESSEQDVASEMSGKMPLPLWNPAADESEI